ncbi:methyltransferase domain-containing protein [Polaribacter sp.]|uniref:methyltransferase domain-containing protein n=1 Tax=Polaribacter sp. TaxID=1920175 RepID=UPI003EF32558
MSNQEIKKIKKPWPTKAAMEQIYQLHLWGDNSSEFYSGAGSHQPEIVTPYVNVVKSFLTSFKKPLVVCDLGCGDFNIGKQLLKCTNKYIAIDIVKDLIIYNQENFTAENLEFHCLDIAKDNLPAADCVLLRQVLQHVSNNEVQNIVSKLKNFKYVILTEHLPVGNFIPNKDIISGQGIRIKKHSGINLLAPPFNFKIKNERQLTVFTLKDKKGVIVTTLYEVF